jgi:hypothetical protein
MERCAPGYLESQVTNRGQTRGREHVESRRYAWPPPTITIAGARSTI